mgnify:FL=1
MPWDNSPQAGFTTCKPWLPLSPDWLLTNVAREQRDPGSMLSLYKRLIQLKKGSRALTAGTYEPIEGGPSDCLLFHRLVQAEGHREAMLIAVNFSARAHIVTLPMTRPISGRIGTLILSTDPRRGEEGWSAERFQLGPDEGIVVKLK